MTTSPGHALNDKINMNQNPFSAKNKINPGAKSNPASLKNRVATVIL